MYGNGVRTGTLVTITADLQKMTHKVQIQAPVALFAVVAGTTSTTSVGLPVVSGTIRPTGTATTAFVWFFRRSDVTLYFFYH